MDQVCRLRSIALRKKQFRDSLPEIGLRWKLGGTTLDSGNVTGQQPFSPEGQRQAVALTRSHGEGTKLNMLLAWRYTLVRPLAPCPSTASAASDVPATPERDGECRLEAIHPCRANDALRTVKRKGSVCDKGAVRSGTVAESSALSLSGHQQV